MALRVLVADDSILFRRVLSDALATLPEVEVVGTAANGKLALAKVRELKPDLLTLDMEMPELDGLGVLDALREGGDKVDIIVVSALTKRGGDLTMQALKKGAFDFITKPEGLTAEQSRALILQELTPRIKTLVSRYAIRSLLKGSGMAEKPSVPAETASAVTPAVPSAAPRGDDLTRRLQRISGQQRADLVVIGVSTGGPAALSQVIPKLPVNLGVPVLIVQHMPAMFTRSLADSLALQSQLKVVEAQDGDQLKPNCVYIAPGGRQMKLVRDGQFHQIRITDDPPENHCRPAVDYLFRSVAQSFSGSVLAVILTGMGSDGTTGIRLLKRQNAFIIAQDEASCVVYGMPKSAVESGVVDQVLPLDQVAGQLIKQCKA